MSEYQPGPQGPQGPPGPPGAGWVPAPPVPAPGQGQAPGQGPVAGPVAGQVVGPVAGPVAGQAPEPEPTSPPGGAGSLLPGTGDQELPRLGGGMAEPAPDVAADPGVWAPPAAPAYPPAAPPGYPPAGPPGYPPAAPPGYPPAAPPGYPPAAPPGYPPAGQPGYPPAGQPYGGPPGYPPAAPPGYPAAPFAPSQWPPAGFAPQPPPKKRRGAKITLAIFLVVALLGLGGIIYAGAKSKSTGGGDLDRMIDRIAGNVETIRGLKFNQPVKHAIVSQDEMARRVREQVGKEMADSSTSITGVSKNLAFLHLIPQSMDLAKFETELLEEQVAGFYDPETKEIVVVDSGGANSAETKVTLAHELTHALDDQHFDLDSIDKRIEKSGDGEAFAGYQAFVEGEATFVMQLYASQYLSTSEMQQLGDSSSEDSSLLDSAPRIIKESLLFPYKSGIEFVQAIHSSGGWNAVNDVYKRIPINTEQILHPARYRQNEIPPPISVSDLTPTASGCSPTDSGTFGERDMEFSLQEISSASKAKKATDGWNGDAYRFDTCASGQLFQAKVRGDSPAETAELLDSWSDFAKGWLDGSGSYSPWPSRSAPSGSYATVKQKGDYVAIVISSETSLGTSAMERL